MKEATLIPRILLLGLLTWVLLAACNLGTNSLNRDGTTDGNISGNTGVLPSAVLSQGSDLSIQFNYPIQGAFISGSISLLARTKSISGVSSVSYYCDNILIGTSTNFPYTVNWNSSFSPNGNHVLTALVLNPQGVAQSNSITISSSNPNLPPIANAGSTLRVSVSNDFTLDASDSIDPNGTIVSWSWSCPGAVNSWLTGEHPTNCYNTPGVYNITLTVRDNDGAIASTNLTLFVTADAGSKRLERETDLSSKVNSTETLVVKPLERISVLSDLNSLAMAMEPMNLVVAQQTK